MKIRYAIALAELVACLLWMLGSDVAGAVLQGWLWTNAAIIIVAFPVAYMAGVSSDPEIKQASKESNDDMGAWMRVLRSAIIAAVCMLKGAPLLAVANTAAVIVFVLFIRTARKEI